jgi:hypothetical protein
MMVNSFKCPTIWRAISAGCARKTPHQLMQCAKVERCDIIRIFFFAKKKICLRCKIWGILALYSDHPARGRFLPLCGKGGQRTLEAFRGNSSIWECFKGNLILSGFVSFIRPAVWRYGRLRFAWWKTSQTCRRVLLLHPSLCISVVLLIMSLIVI